MREKDFELWDICGRPGSLCVTVEDMVVNVSGDNIISYIFQIDHSCVIISIQPSVGFQ